MVGLIAAFGGGILSSLLLQDPKRAPIALLESNSIGIIWTACWWLVNYLPGGLVAKLLSLRPCKLAAKACLNILRAGLMAARVDLAVELFPGVVAAPLLLGSIAGTGGRFSIDPILAAIGELPGPHEISVPTFAARSGFVGAAGYWLAVHVYRALSAAEGKALIMTAFLAHGALSDLVGHPLDWTYPLARVAHALARVPMPDALAGAAGRAAASVDSRPTPSESKKDK
ncbi:hypothetical protein WJX81_006890 [Elliptochloris bilobata]|uniref:Uncharacterized protein n=1 Tax=Elliptochloris bilobata TaxID=381761 RepID=A0AAW1S3Q6_9CHLO